MIYRYVYGFIVSDNYKSLRYKDFNTNYYVLLFFQCYNN